MTRFDKIEHLFAALLGFFLAYVTYDAALLVWHSYHETGDNVFLFIVIALPLLELASLCVSAYAIYIVFFKKAP